MGCYLKCDIVKPGRGVENERGEEEAPVSPWGVLFGEGVDGLDSTPDVDHIIEDVGQGLAVVRHR